MNAAAVITLIFGSLTVLGAAFGYLLNRLAIAHQIIDTQRETIANLSRQIDRLELTADWQDKLNKTLRQALDTGPS